MRAEFFKVRGTIKHTPHCVGWKFDLARFSGSGIFNKNCSALSFAKAQALVWGKHEFQAGAVQRLPKEVSMADLLLTAAKLLFQETAHSERMSNRDMAVDKQQKQSIEKKFKVIKAQAERRHFFSSSSKNLKLRRKSCAWWSERRWQTTKRVLIDFIWLWSASSVNRTMTWRWF